MDPRYRATALEADPRKTIVAWPPVQTNNSGAATTFVSLAGDPITLQGLYATSVAPMEGVPVVGQTFLPQTDSVPKVMHLQPSSLSQEGGLVIINSSPMPEGVFNISAHSSREDDHVSNLSEDTPARVKLLCSYGGKILPRPSDGRLRYVGGDTRMISVNRDTTYANLLLRMSEVQRQTVSIKYQLPDEDLDALVSVSSDEDLENMMEEYDKLEAGDGNPRLRVFLFTSLDYESQVMEGSGNSEQQYLDAVNGIVESTSRKQSESSSSPQSNPFVPEAAPPAVSAVRVSQGVPIVVPPATVPALANGVLPGIVTPSGIHYAYVDGNSGQAESETAVPKLVEVRNVLGQVQYMVAPEVVESERQAPQVTPQVRFQQIIEPQVAVSEPQKEVNAAGYVQWPVETTWVTTTHSYDVASSQQQHWPAANVKVHSDPSPVIPPQSASPYLKPQLPMEQVYTEPISSYEYQAVGEKLNLQKPKELQENVNWNLRQQDVRAPGRDGNVFENNGYSSSDGLHLMAIGSTLTSWSTQSNTVGGAETLYEPEVKTVADVKLTDALVNFLEDSLYAVRTERPFGSGSDSSVTMAHSGTSSNNMPMDLLTSDDVYCKTSSTVSRGSTAASSASASSSHAFEVAAQALSESSPVTRVLHEEGPPLISLHDEDKQEIRQRQLEAVVEEGIMKQMAGLSTESFAFGNQKKEETEQNRDGNDRQLETSDLQTVSAEVGLTTGIETTTLMDLADTDEGATISVAESEAIARARGLQIIKHEDLEEIRELGSGTFGTVFHGKWRGTDVAIKRIKASCFYGSPSEQARLKEDFWSEACILAHLHHPNVVAFYGVVPDSPGGTLATVTEFMANGSLKQVLHKKDRLIDRRRRLLIAMDAAFGMEYLHDKKIIHFDLKGENLLVNVRDTQRPVCKVGDLGLSKIKHKTMVTGGVRGTLPWMAPELLNGKTSLVSEKVDVFSFGIVMWELLTGEEPYAELHYGAIIGGIVSNALRPPVPSYCETEWKSLMERCWADDPAERPTFSEIVRELRSMMASLAKQIQNSQGQQSPPVYQAATTQ